MSVWVAGISAAVSVGGSIYAGQSAKKAGQKQADAQLKATGDTNAANERMFHEARGSKGHALLPEYFGEFEKNLGTDISGTYSSYKFDPQFGNKTYRQMSDSFMDGNEIIDDVMSGRVGAERSGLSEGLAESRRSSINTALGERLAALKAARQAGGYGGTSSFQEKMMLGDTLQARQMASMSDWMDKQQVYDSNLQLQLGLLDAPLNRTMQGYQMGSLPGAEQYRGIDEVLKRLGYFNMQGGNPPQAINPEIPTIPGMGQFVGPAISSTAGTMFNAYMNRPQTVTPTGINTAGGGQSTEYAKLMNNSNTNLGSNTQYFPMFPGG